MVAKVNGSAGWMPKRTDSTARAPASAAGRPIARPSATSRSESRRIIQTTCARGAPRAIRRPISPVRRAVP